MIWKILPLRSCALHQMKFVMMSFPFKHVIILLSLINFSDFSYKQLFTADTELSGYSFFFWILSFAFLSLDIIWSKYLYITTYDWINIQFNLKQMFFFYTQVIVTRKYSDSDILVSLLVPASFVFLSGFYPWYLFSKY